MAKVFVSKSTIHGKGVFAGRNFRRGDRIGTFTGRPTKKVDHKWVLHCYDGDKELDLMCDGPLRYVNHDDKPNARIRWDRSLVATRKIQKGEEVFVDYEG